MSSATSVKSVLVSHLERKVIFKIPKEKCVSDVEFLILEFKKKFSHESNAITFQRFDADWDQIVDLEENEVLNDKDKLTAVITLTPQSQKVSPCFNMIVYLHSLNP